MYQPGSAIMLPRIKKLVAQIAVAIKSLPNKVKIASHTDSIPFKSLRKGYSNWGLSSERAQASRRILVDDGLDPVRITAVEGRASRDPLLPDDTKSPRNRRMTILVLRNPSPKDARASATGAGSSTDGKGRTGTGKPLAPAKLNKDLTGPRVR